MRIFTLEVTFGESNLEGRSELVPGRQAEELEIAEDCHKEIKTKKSAVGDT